ncbi:hypothetical protein BC939DRAFT_465609 [Gamsiella multidivaricata]|uniref:uncharacterized protein n=1 Tax=Gamsiella multidivaricata TaxID=101098 RepID=UPI00221FBC70|nr:uncharacterized protein BC939DRAFT_465609 [Gamsiella multidivaricata]KAI7817519.1 hypothetical protein BC939DRAFT_465609 [Gamsiella multidivaricata]
MTAMSNPMFDDFIELDLLDTTETTSDMFSYYLGGAPGLDDNTPDLGAAAAALVATAPDESVAALDIDIDIKREDLSDSDTHMLLDPSPLNQPLELSPDAHLTLVSPDQLTIAPQATVSLATVSPASAADVSEASTTTIDAASVSTPSKSTAAKRSSPEPSTAARKHAKTESVSKSKSSATSARKSSTSAASPTTAVAAAPSKASSATKSTASLSSPSSSSISTPTSSSSTTSASSSEFTAESLTSTANTTLSPATLQFLLQQQGDTPLIPQLFTGKLSREEIEATLARLLESTKHLIATTEDVVPIKEEDSQGHGSDDDSDDNMESAESAEAAEQTHGLKTQPGIKTDDIPSSTDLKKMTSKERRQLRNKISARNFRVRRKEYIFTLEGQVLQHKTEARHLREAVTLVQEENQRLKSELESVRRQLEGTTINNSAATAGTSVVTAAASSEQTQSIVSTAPLSKESQSLLTSLLNRNVSSALNANAKSNLTLTLPRPQSPILTPNTHKDVPNSSSGSASQNSWKDKNPIMVHTTLVPEICLGDEFQFGGKAGQSKDDVMIDRPWMKLGDVVQETKFDANPFWISGVIFELMKTFTSMTMAMSSPESEIATVEETMDNDVESDADLDWEVQQSLWALSQGEDEEEQIQLLYDLSQLQVSSAARPESPAPAQEDPNMLEWLYESMMARLVDMDLQSTQEPSSFAPLSEAHMA